MKIQIKDKEITALLRRFNPMYKAEVIQVNISSTFMPRGARCIQCGEPPIYYYYIRNPYLWKDPRSRLTVSKWMRGWVQRLTDDWYLDSEPKFFQTIEDFSFILGDKQYRPTVHRVRDLDPKAEKNVTEMVGCPCGATMWSFNQKSTKKRPEITNRKGRYKYPERFEY
jgi:hypothetical protein